MDDSLTWNEKLINTSLWGWWVCSQLIDTEWSRNLAGTDAPFPHDQRCRVQHVVRNRLNANINPGADRTLFVNNTCVLHQIPEDKN